MEKIALDISDHSNGWLAGLDGCANTDIHSVESEREREGGCRSVEPFYDMMIVGRGISTPSLPFFCSYRLGKEGIHYESERILCARGCSISLSLSLSLSLTPRAELINHPSRLPQCQGHLGCVCLDLFSGLLNSIYPTSTSPAARGAVGVRLWWCVEWRKKWLFHIKFFPAFG